MESWWSLGEDSGYHGAELSTFRITCPFCFERGNYRVEHHVTKRKPNSEKILNYDTLECGSYRGYVMVLWSHCETGFGGEVHDFRVLPWPLRYERYPEHWSEGIGRYWLQAKRNLSDENWDASILMARSALQIALRDKGAVGNNLKQEVEYLAENGILPPIMKDWAENIRELGNEAAHPQPEQPLPEPRDARDLVRFLDFLLEYLYDLPHRIDRFQERR